jgi:glycosyltransferase involved in cell wall biosynthesis
LSAVAFSEGKALRIVHITPCYYPAWSYGAVPRVVYELSRRQSRLGHEVTVLTTDVYDERSRVVADSYPVLIEGVRTFYLRNVSNRLAYSQHLFTPAGLDADAKVSLLKADVVHMHRYGHVLNHMARRVTSGQRIPYVFSAHGSVPLDYSKVAVKKVYDHTLGKSLLAGASIYLAVSEAERKKYVTAGLDDGRIRVVYNGIPVEEFASLPPKGEFKSMYNIPLDYKVVLYLGRVGPRKGVDFLVKAVAMLGRPDVLLVVAGHVQADELEFLSKLSVQHEVQDKVIFTGLLTDMKRLAAYRDADVTVFPSEKEVFGLSPFESIMCGTPAIVSDDSGACEIMSRAGAGDPVEYGNSIELAGAIARMLDDRRRAKNLVDRGRRFIEHDLSWDVLTPKYVAAYESVLSGFFGTD